ncbi:hypothetical protein HOY80DRAFT_386476 [Tuber brumale]|nr:hypothetical protein HOY80DRAFT_386476 [Tuber brumale]
MMVLVIFSFLFSFLLCSALPTRVVNTTIPSPSQTRISLELTEFSTRKKEKGGNLMLVSKHRYIHSWKETLGKYTKEEKNEGKRERKKTRHPSYLNTTPSPDPNIKESAKCRNKVYETTNHHHHPDCSTTALPNRKSRDI